MIQESDRVIERDSHVLVVHARARSQAVRDAVQKTRKAIESEIEKNEGLYPYNGGRLSQAEFCRRAGISQVTLLGTAHKASTKQELDQWLRQVTRVLLTGKRVVRKAVTERADSWERRYREVANHYNLFKIEMIAKEETIELHAKKIAELEEEILRLLQQVSEGRVVHIQKKGKRG